MVPVHQTGQRRPPRAIPLDRQRDEGLTTQEALCAVCLIKQGEFLVFLDEASLIDAEDDAVGAYAEHLFIGKSDDDAKICASSDLLIYLRRETLKVITSICLIHTLSKRICAHLMLITAV